MGNLPCLRKDKDDAWKQQNIEMPENPAFKFANLAKGGSLIDAYNEFGIQKVKEIAREEISKFFYHPDGKKHTISLEEQKLWHKKYQRRVAGQSLDTISDEELLEEEYEEHDFYKVAPHDACWDLNKRGGVGETPFHLLYLMDSPVHFEVAKILLQMYPNLALDVYEGEEYYGESALHIAIVVGDFDSVQLLVEAGANVNQRATGRFFLPEDQKKGYTGNTSYEGYAYYGEYPLAFAACLGNTDIYDYLLEHGADPNLQDTFGNTVLHMVVIADQKDMYRYAVRHHKIRAITSIKNKQNLTPLTLACKLARHAIFQDMLDLDSIELWRFSTTMCSVHPLHTLDSIGPDGSTNWNSALMIIVNGDKDGHLEMLEGGVMRQLLIEKWKTFALHRFLFRLGLAVLHLVLFSIAIYLRPSESCLLCYKEPKDVIRFVSEIIVCLSCVATVSYEVMEISSQGMRTFFKNLTHAPAQTIYLVSCLLVLACIPFRILGKPEVENILIILAAPCTWFFSLFFARGHKLTGPFVTMIYKMCAGDLLRFGIIYIIFLITFAQSFFMLFRGVPDPNIEGDEAAQGVKRFFNIPETIMYLFQMTLGEFKYDTFSYARYEPLTKIIFALFMILVPILLLNMLIAMMGNTYIQVISKSTKEWWKQWAQILIVLERGISKKKLLEFQKSYSVKLAGKPSPDDGKPSQQNDRALVVIKLCNKSRAKTRKWAIHKWKAFGKEIIRQRKMWHKKHDESQPFALSHSLTKGQLEDDNLLSSTVAQLAWEKDIDLTKGQKFVTDLDYITPRSPSLLSPAHHLSPIHLPNGSAHREQLDISQSPPDMTDAADVSTAPIKRRKNLVYNRVAPLLLPRSDPVDSSFSEPVDNVPSNNDLLMNSMELSLTDNTSPFKSFINSQSEDPNYQIPSTPPWEGNGDAQEHFYSDSQALMELQKEIESIDSIEMKSRDSGIMNPAFDTTCWMEESTSVPPVRKRKKKIKKVKLKNKKKNPAEDKGSNSSVFTLTESGSGKL